MIRVTKTLVILLALGGLLRAQSGRIRDASSVTPSANKSAEGTNGGALEVRSARDLYEAANNYVTNKFAEFEKRKMPYDAKLADKIRQEQRDVASRYAIILAARKPEGEDVYYLGMLYNLARNNAAALEAMRTYLKTATNATGQPAQDARAIVAIQAAKSGLLPEAEETLSEYAKHEPQRVEDRYAVENTVAAAYLKTNDYEHALPHAQQMLATAKLMVNDKAPLERDRTLFESAILVSDVYLKLKKDSDAVATVQDLRRLALNLPSGNLYKLALRRLIQIAPGIDLFKSFEDAPISAGAVKEINAKDWIDRPPTRLADLRGQVVLLDFWAPWCGPCRATFPRLQKWDESYKKKGLVILGVTKFYGHAEGKQLAKAEELDYLKEFKKRFNLTYGFVVADSDDNDLSYGVYSIPTTFLIDRRGVVRFISIGSGDEENSALGRMIKKLIEEPVPAIEATAAH